MKFGLESEKFIFNLKNNRPSNGVFRFLDAMTDFQVNNNSEVVPKMSNEFVLSMIEFGTTPSSSPMEVLKEYLYNYLITQSVASREEVALVPLGSLPMNYLPQMVPKWAYLIQNSILAKKRQKSWTMTKNSPLREAGNCAGMHVHIEVETPAQFLFSNRELQDKFNMGLMMSPLIAFGSSPYFFGTNSASSMRGQKYYNVVYKDLPLNGGLPPVMSSSIEILHHVLESNECWINHGTKIGFSRDELYRLTSKKGANWNPVRWNQNWNTIEIRCLDSDSIDLDASKFIWITGAMGRMDTKKESLKCSVIKSKKKLDLKMIQECFETSGGEVRILGTEEIREIFNRAINFGTKDEFVETYLYKLAQFSQEGLDEDYKWAFQILKRSLNAHSTTSEILLEKTKNRLRITDRQAVDLVRYSIHKQEKIIKAISKYIPEIFLLVQEKNLSF